MRTNRSKLTKGTGFVRGMEDIHLRPWGEVAAMWNARSTKKPITRARVIQIAKEAEQKIRAALAASA